MITCSLGLDLGGTHIKAAVVGREGQLLDQTLAPTPAGRELEPVVAALDALCRQMLRAHPDIQSLGIGAPGLVDLSRKIVRVAPNFPAWHNIPLQEMAAAQVALPVQIENDVNCFALAEHRWGAGRGAKNMVALAVGTGVGGALVLNGRLYRGAGGAAGELGHISVDLWGPKCACGNLGCIERYLGEHWFTQAAREQLNNDEINSPADVSRLAAGGDQQAQQFIAGRGEMLGVVCASLIHTLDPEIIVIGGGIAQAGEAFFHGVRRAVQERAYSILAAKVPIVPAKLGTIAGAMGAASLGLEG